ncbi:MAG: amidohydrolase family protein, partial [Euryarchaeota archaeon]|nr:amidohydrolase family protein [Euryarchaeota archaeon]
MLIDSHVHLGGPDAGDGATQSEQELLERMERAGVDCAVAFPFNDSGAGECFSASNRRLAEVQRRHERIVCFARLDPNSSVVLQEAARCIEELGLRGFKLHPTAQKFTPSHPAVEEILRLAARLGVPVVFDNGKRESGNLEIARVAERVPEAQVILAHIRGEGAIEACEGRSNLYLGTVKAPPEKVVEAVDRLGASRVIAGSDAPYASMRYEMVEKFENL